MKKTENLIRCPWPSDDPLYIRYHDEEWGLPVYDDKLLFAKLLLDGAQAGLSWITILRKRENYWQAYDNFDAEKYKDELTDEQKDVIKNREGDLI